MELLAEYKAGDELAEAIAWGKSAEAVEKTPDVEWVAKVEHDQTFYIISGQGNSPTKADVLLFLGAHDEDYSGQIESAEKLVKEIHEGFCDTPYEEDGREEVVDEIMTTPDDGTIFGWLAITRPQATISDTVDCLESARLVANDLLPIHAVSKKEFFGNRPQKLAEFMLWGAKKRIELYGLSKENH